LHCCQISGYQRHETVAKTAKIARKVADATPCPNSENELKSISECKNVTVCLLYAYITYSLQLIDFIDN
jgi:hypothetical protein